jgi:cysteine desulfuration protein SufE
MTEPVNEAIPPEVERVLGMFRRMSREDRMQALLQYSRKLEPLPERFQALDRAPFIIPECQTSVALFPEYREGKLYFHVDLDARRSPTIAAFLGILLAAVNGKPPAATLALPATFARVAMDSIGLGVREVGLNAMVERMKTHARDAAGEAPPESPLQ